MITTKKDKNSIYGYVVSDFVRVDGTAEEIKQLLERGFEEVNCVCNSTPCQCPSDLDEEIVEIYKATDLI